MIELRGIQKEYLKGKKRVAALRGVDLEISLDDYLAVQGPSGAGKSTLLNVIGLLDEPTAGSILLRGDCVSKLDDKHRSRLRNEAFGFVFQRFNLVSGLTAWQNVALPGRYGGWGRRERRIRALDLLDRFGLADRADHLPAELSGGEEQRVAIARALLMVPQMILADEPTGNLDSSLAQEILSLFTSIHEEGTAVVVVTHEAAVVEVAQRTILLVDGVIVPCKQLLTEPE